MEAFEELCVRSVDSTSEAGMPHQYVVIFVSGFAGYPGVSLVTI